MSGHSKVYGICENKCMIEVSPKTKVDEIETKIETIKPKYLYFTNAGTYEVEMKDGLTIYANSNVSNSIIKFKNNTTEKLYVMIGENYSSSKFLVKVIGVSPNTSRSETVESGTYCKRYDIVKREDITIEPEE